ncbi:MAG: hypothetical protein ACYCO9_16460 [Streptosporangiaceae bacterium]
MPVAWTEAGTGLLLMFAAAAGALWRGGRRDGKIDAVLERLTDISSDHEKRIRDLEHDPP